MSDAITKAKNFLSEEQAFRLGELPTESSHPKTRGLSETIQADLRAGIHLLQSVDEDIAPVAEKILRQETFSQADEFTKGGCGLCNRGRPLFLGTPC